MELNWLQYWWPLALIGGVGVLTATSCFGWITLRVLLFVRRQFGAPPAPLSDQRENRVVRRPASLVRLMAAFSAGCLGLALFSLTFVLLSQIYAYRALTAIELVGELKCERLLGPRRYVVTYTPVQSGQPLEPYRTELRGEQWVVGADILRWRPFMGYLGFHASYKITRLEGRYLTASDQKTEPRTAIDLGGGSDKLWLALYRQERIWPYSLIIDSVYGSAVYQFLEPGATFQIFIGRDGLLTKPLASSSTPPPPIRPVRSPAKQVAEE